jgi:hypothetical protein
MADKERERDDPIQRRQEKEGQEEARWPAPDHIVQ